MERAQPEPAPDEHAPQDDEHANDDETQTALETGRPPRPSQAEGDRETVEEDLDERE